VQPLCRRGTVEVERILSAIWWEWGEHGGSGGKRDEMFFSAPSDVPAHPLVCWVRPQDAG
jgi:hypothetical protein